MKSIHPKVAAGSIAGAVTLIVVFAADQLGVSIPPEVASALTTVFSFIAGFRAS